MVKVFVAIAVVVALAGVVSAKHHRPGHFEEEEFEHRHPTHGGHYRSPLQHLTSEELLEELSLRGHGGFGHHGRRGLNAGRHGKRGLRHGGRFEGAGLGGVGAVGGVGAIGGLDARKERLGAIGGSTHLGERGSIEASKGGLIAGEKHLNVGQHDDSIRDVEGKHAHQAFKNDKTIIKDRSSGVSDVDSFRNTDAESHGSNLSVGAAGIAAKQGNIRAEGAKEFDAEAGAVGAERESLTAGGAIGAVGAAGAAGAGAAHSD